MLILKLCSVYFPNKEHQNKHHFQILPRIMQIKYDDRFQVGFLKHLIADKSGTSLNYTYPLIPSHSLLQRIQQWHSPSHSPTGQKQQISLNNFPPPVNTIQTRQIYCFLLRRPLQSEDRIWLEMNIEKFNECLLLL